MIRAVRRGLHEPVNALTHLLGAVLGVAGTAALLVAAAGEPRKLVAFAVYGTSLVLLFSASTLLHALRVREATRRKLRIFDHAAIFLLIAGSYTPLALVTLGSYSPAWGWAVLGTTWGLAVLGVVFKLFWIGAPRWLSTGLYLLLGWMALTAIVPLTRTLPGGGFFWLLVGGAFYSVGAIIYARRAPDPWPGVFGYHELWHLFVLAGAASHFVLMFRYVLPA